MNLALRRWLLDVSRSGYYDFLKTEKSTRAKENERLKAKIKDIHEMSRGTYGSPRIHAEIKKQGEKCSRRRVAKLMREEKIQAKMRKKWKKTTQRDEKAEARPNHLDQNFTTEALNKVWVSDITYVPTREGWLYVAIVMDLFSRKVVGHGGKFANGARNKSFESGFSSSRGKRGSHASFRQRLSVY